jgi:hypothetical protein
MDFSVSVGAGGSGHRLFRMAWADRRSPENNADTGAADDQPDTCSAAGAPDAVPRRLERIDFTPWHGWEMSQAGGDQRSAPSSRRWVGGIGHGRVMTLAIARRR